MKSLVAKIAAALTALAAGGQALAITWGSPDGDAADAVVQGVAAPDAIDLAMQKGVNYPRGPLAWADAIGAGTVRDALAHLAAHYGEDRYRTSPLVARRAATGGTLLG